MNNMMNQSQMPAPQQTQVPKSVFSKEDMMVGMAKGDIDPQRTTVGEFLQTQMGISPNDPLQKLIEATKGQLQTSSVEGKLSAMKGQAPQGGAPAPMAPQGPPNLDGLVNTIGGNSGRY